MRRKIENVSYLHCYFLISFCSFLLQRAEVFGKCLACAHKFRMSAVPEHWLRHAPITNDFPEHDGNRYPVQFSSVTQSCLTLCNSMNHSTPGLPVHHQLPEFTQTHVHRVCDAIQPSHPLLYPSPHAPPSPPAPIPSSIKVFSNGSTLRMRCPKYWSFSFNISPSNEHPGLISLGWTGWISLQSKGLSRVFFNITVQTHQFFGVQLSSQSSSHIHTWPLEKP